MTSAALRRDEDEAPVVATARAALYLRVSTGRQAESDLSIPDRLRDEEGQTTAEYALVLLGAASVALLIAMWAKEGGKVSGSIELEPGVYKDGSEVTYDELKKAFWTPDFKQPPEALFKVLGLLSE